MDHNDVLEGQPVVCSAQVSGSATVLLSITGRGTRQLSRLAKGTDSPKVLKVFWLRTTFLYIAITRQVV